MTIRHKEQKENNSDIVQQPYNTFRICNANYQWTYRHKQTEYVIKAFPIIASNLNEVILLFEAYMLYQKTNKSVFKVLNNDPFFIRLDQYK